ncbi:MAG TPA: response regulator transcription factor [Bacteroidales bacterium]|nr:response regulator transcription factor [Bacteroidales bacterium]
MKILLVEDEPELARSIIHFLVKEGYSVDRAQNYREADKHIAGCLYDCLLLDITLPDGNGLNLINKVKERNDDSGIIIITAKNSLNDRVAGLDLGADDYLSKPFHLAELNSRIKSLLRRRKSQGLKVITIDDLKIIPENFQVFVLDKEIELTRKEFDLLLFLVSNKNRVLTKESIADHIWGDVADFTYDYDFIYSHIKNIRRKITENGGTDNIVSIYGIGYKYIKS